MHRNTLAPQAGAGCARVCLHYRTYLCSCSGSAGGFTGEFDQQGVVEGMDDGALESWTIINTNTHARRLSEHFESPIVCGIGLG